MEGDITGLEFMVTVRQRRQTLRRNLRRRVRDEDYPEHDDTMIQELALLRRIARILKMPLELN